MGGALSFQRLKISRRLFQHLRFENCEIDAVFTLRSIGPVGFQDRCCERLAVFAGTSQLELRQLLILALSTTRSLDDPTAFVFIMQSGCEQLVLAFFGSLSKRVLFIVRNVVERKNAGPTLNLMYFCHHGKQRRLRARPGRQRRHARAQCRPRPARCSWSSHPSP